LFFFETVETETVICNLWFYMSLMASANVRYCPLNGQSCYLKSSDNGWMDKMMMYADECRTDW